MTPRIEKRQREMSTRFSQSFKLQAVEKALRRAPETNMLGVAKSLGVGYSTLQKWIAEARTGTEKTTAGSECMLNQAEKRPEDWSLEERLAVLIKCGTMDAETANQECRQQGIYPHHLTQWRQDFIKPAAANHKTELADLKKFKQENSVLKKDLNRKNKALAEAAALIVLQKKVSALWSNDEADSQ
jgi:transposase-like protein